MDGQAAAKALPGAVGQCLTGCRQGAQDDGGLGAAGGIAAGAQVNGGQAAGRPETQQIPGGAKADPHQIPVIGPGLVLDFPHQEPTQAAALGGGVHGDAQDAGPTQERCLLQAGMGAKGLGQQMAARPPPALVDVSRQVRGEAALPGDQGGGGDLAPVYQDLDLDVGPIQEVAQVQGARLVMGQDQETEELGQAGLVARQGVAVELGMLAVVGVGVRQVLVGGGGGIQ